MFFILLDKKIPGYFILYDTNEHKRTYVLKLGTLNEEGFPKPTFCFPEAIAKETPKVLAVPLEFLKVLP